MLKEQVRELFALGEKEADKSQGDINTLKDIWENVADLFPGSRFVVTTPEENVLRIGLKRTPEERKKPSNALTALLTFAQPSIEILELGDKQFGVFSNAIGASTKEASPEAVITYLSEFSKNTRIRQAAAKPVAARL